MCMYIYTRMNECIVVCVWLEEFLLPGKGCGI